MRREAFRTNVAQALHPFTIKWCHATMNRIMNPRLRIVFIGLTVSFATACVQGAVPSTPPAVVEHDQMTATPVLLTEGDATQMSPSLTPPANAGLQGLIETAKADLAQRLGIPVNDVVLVEAASVTWPDGSLGCPQPGMEYAQALVPGYLIRLQVGSQEFEYHTSRGTTIVYCENPSPPVPGTPADV